MEEVVILVDEEDIEIGAMNKLEAHQKGLLHRAFSVFVFNSKGELLLQQRADHKYHSAGLWTNTCCSHPRKGENLEDAVSRRLMEEMGMLCQAEHKFSFKYKICFENGLTEHEFDHVFLGYSDEQAVPNPGEVKAVKYITLEKLQDEIRLYPGSYSAWIRICLPRVMEVLKR